MPGPRCLIIDEVHEFNNPDSIKSKALYSIIKQFEYRYLITATPAINHFYKWYGIIRLLDQSIFPYNYRVFLLYIAQTIGDQYNPYKVEKYNVQVVKKVEEALSPYIIKRSKHEIPMATKQVTKAVYFKLPMIVRSLYNVMSKKEFYVFQNDTYKKKNILTSFPYTLQILDNPLLLRDKIIDREIQNYLDDIKFEHDPRVIYLESFMKELAENNEKLIIYDIHPQTLDMLAEHFKQYSPITIHGEKNLTAKEKEDLLDRFRNKNDPCKLILLSAQSMSAGVNLQQGASKIVFFSLPNDALLVGQGMERVWRITSVNDSLVLFFVFDKTFDTYRYFRVKRRIEYNDVSFTRTFSESEIEGLLNGIEPEHG
jgi:SNF2 family DNA or RNA helicase